MKKNNSTNCVSSGNKLLFTLLLPLFALFLSVNGLVAQQIIGTFPYMNGGFEGQTAGALGTTLSATLWTRQNQTGASTTIVTASPRTGINYASIVNVTAVSRPLQSPQLQPFDAAKAPIASTAYMVQFFAKNALAISAFQVGTNTNGTSSTNYSTNSYILPANATWTKYTIATTTNSAAVTSSGIAIVGRCITGTFDIDDVVIYPGTSADGVVPDAPTSPTIPAAAATQQTVSWTAPGTGVDGGGYMVVRSTADPATTPNPNGIYAVGNFVAGTEKVVYLGTNTSFIDLGLTQETHYYYRIYTVDKAFNYSSPIAIDGSTTAPSYATEPTGQASGISFTNVTSTSIDINWTAGNGTSSLVVVRAGSAVNADPIDGSTYTPNTVYGSGMQIGTGNYAVYNGTGNSVSITGLGKAITYYVKVYTFNGSTGSENYLITSPAAGSQLATPGEIVSTGLNSAGVSYSTGSAWVGGIAPTRYDNVTIVSGDVFNVGSTQACYNLTIQSSGKIAAGSAQTFQMYGNSLACEGTFGDPSAAVSLLSLEYGGNLTISGSGSINPYRVRPVTGLSNVSVIFDTPTTTVTYGTVGILSDNGTNDNVTITVNAGKTVNVLGNMSATGSSTGIGGGNVTLNVYGTLNVGNNFNPTVASGKTYGINVFNGGLLAISTLSNTKNFSLAPSHATQAATSITVNTGGEIKVYGIMDCSNPSYLSTITGGGTFSTVSGATLQVSNSTGLDNSTGYIRTGTRIFDAATNYQFVGTSAQVTGSDFPSTLNNLTINNAAGVTLNAGITVNGILTLNAGTLTNTAGLTLGNSASTIRTGGSLSESPTFGTAVNVTYGGTFTTQSATTVLNSQSVTLSATNTNIVVGMPVSGTGITTGTTVSAISGTALTLSLNATAAGTNTLSFGYNTAQTAGYELPSSSSVLSNLIVNNTAGVTLNAGTTVNGALTLTAGELATGANTLTLKGAISGTGTIATGASGTLTFAGSAVQTLDGANVTSNAVNNLIVEGGSRLTTSGTIAVTNLTINSSNLRVAGTLLGTLTATNASVNQYLGDARNWYITSPVSNAKAPAGYTYYQRDEVGASWTTQPFSATNDFIAGKGYIAMPGFTGSTLTFATETGGSLNTGNVTVALTKGSTTTAIGYNLIGNPYPSHLAWTSAFVDDVTNATIIDPTIWIRTNSGSSNTGGWSFLTYNGHSGEAAPSTTLLTGGIIPPMQAFWVKALKSDNLILDSKLTRSHQASNPLKAPAVKNSDRQRLRLELDNGTTTDETLIYFDAAALDSYDRYDSPKFVETSANATQIYTSIGTEKLVINGMNTIQLDNPISLGFVPGSGTSFSIKANEISNLPSDVKVILKDNVTMAETDLTDGISTYSFSPEITSVDRFSIIFRTSGAVTGLMNNTNNSMLVYYNNNHGLIIKTNNDKLIGSTVSVYNALGQQLISTKLSGVTMNIDFPYSPNVYFVKVDNVLKKVTVK